MNKGIILKNSWGFWEVSWEGEKVISLHLPENPSKKEGKWVDFNKYPFLRKLSLQLEEYLQGKEVSFNVPYSLKGTDFQIKVWLELQKIPYGQTRTYGEIAKGLGGINKARAVGGACNKNPLALIVPCHRIIGQEGKLVGFGGGLGLKRKLLCLEGGKVDGNRYFSKSHEKT